MDLYDVILETAAFSDSTYAKVAFGYEEDLMYPDSELTEKLAATAEKLGKHIYKGIGSSGDAFYGDPEIRASRPRKYDIIAGMMKTTLMFGLLFGACTCLSSTATTTPGDLDPHARDYMRFRTACQTSGLSSPALLLGKASSMEKIMPRGRFSALPVTKDGLAVRLAGNEYESVQLLVAPTDSDLADVKVRMEGDLKGPNATFAATNVACDVTGYVKTTSRPPYKVGRAVPANDAPGYTRKIDDPVLGWWPDPILDFCPSVAVKQGELQSFWIRAHARRGQTPGVYRGTLTVQADNVTSIQLPFSVTVFDFALPDQPPLPTAISWNHPSFEKSARQQRGGAENWPKMKFVYADFLTDYLLDWGNIYITTPPDFEVVQYLHDKGKLTTFGLGDATVR